MAAPVNPNVRRKMETFAKSIVAAVLAGLLVLGGFLVSWEVFLRFVEGHTFSGRTGLFLSQVPIMVARFGLGAIAGGILAILTYRRRPLVWALLMSLPATLVTVHMRTTTYFTTPPIMERIIHGADPYMFIPGAILGALVVSWVLRLTKGSTGRGVTSGPAKPGEFSGGAG